MPTSDDVAALSGLTRLQSLTIKAQGERQPQQQQEQPGSNIQSSAPQPFPSCLTSLTQLQLPRELAGELDALGACSKLCSIELLGCSGKPLSQHTELSSADWQAIGQLTQLTWLLVDYPVLHDSAAAAAAALARLVKLRGFVAYSLGSDRLLPALRGLSGLTSLGGRVENALWGMVQSGAPWSGLRELLQVSENLSPRAFPNVTRLTIGYSIRTADLAFLTQHCPGLRELGVCVDGTNCQPTLYGVTHAQPEPTAQVAAVQSLSSLRSLTRLEFAANYDGEVAALVNVACALVSGSLRHLVLLVPSASSVSAVALTQLSKVVLAR